MKFHEILKSPILASPFSYDTDFKIYFHKKLNEYLELLKSLEDPIDIPYIRTKCSSLYKIQSEFITGLMDTLDIYLYGKPNQAYNKFENVIINRNKKIQKLFKIEIIENNVNFYRIRIIKNNDTIDRNEFFHIPFEKRTKVDSQRYSVPGFPCLYLGKTIYVCWEELLKPNIHEFRSVRIKLKKTIKYVNLVPPIIEGELNDIKYYRYIILWPLIFACSIKIKEYEHPFKPEYIFPQLLLQYIRNNNNIDGLCYWSTCVKENPLIFKGMHENFVLPVKTNNLSGLCPILCDKFEITEPVSFQMFEFSGLLHNFAYNPNVLDFENMNEDIEIIPGEKIKYVHTIFGKLEYYLQGLKSFKLP